MVAQTEGFIRIPNWIVDDSGLSLHELAVYIVLLRFRDPSTGKCFPGMSTIADRARLSRKSVERAIKDLEGRGMLRVTRRSSIRDNKPNVYEVAIPTESPADVLATSSRGRRIPKRPLAAGSLLSRTSPSDVRDGSRGTDSESPGRGGGSPATDSESVGRDSESVGRDSESLPPRTRSLPNKIHTTRSKNKIHEQAVRSAPERGPEIGFTFDEPEGATEKQLTLLRDLAIIVAHTVPTDIQLSRWRKLTTAEAHDQIRGYLKNTGVGGMWTGPAEGTPLWNELSPLSQRWYLAGAVPGGLEDVA